MAGQRAIRVKPLTGKFLSGGETRSSLFAGVRKNMTFPDDNVEDSWLEKYEPQFFVYPGKSIYMRINEQHNGNYIFTLGTLPTYVCRGSKKE